jgi:hypothetical protein
LINFSINSNHFEKLSHNNGQYIVLGDDYGTKICLKESSGEIFSIDDQYEYPTRFVNSNIKSLVIFLQIYEYNKAIAIELSDRKVQRKMFQELEPKFLQVDPKALSDEGTSITARAERMNNP